ncbi:hypothetical protein DVH24_015144 [Malus domestica]|uniref:Phospholipase n=1 Tax=Malus domestica TaxID=3750 RepID=A0A498K7B9_MALDO|nr:hypothetical protein DVH24_015144 [Malus domestica]
MSSEKLLATGFVQSDAVNMNVGSFSFTPIFEELPVATIVSVSRPETGDISPMLLSYTIEFQYKQAKLSLSLCNLYLYELFGMVCKFLEVSKLSFLQEYGPKLKEGYVMVKHLPKITGANSDVKSCAYLCLDCCSNNWQKVWAVLKPGFLALLEDPFDTELLDIIVFNVLPDSKEIGQSKIYLANQIKERNPLRYTFRVACGNQSLRLRTTSNAKVKGWVTAINDAVSRPHEGWCHPHRFGSFAPPRGLADDGSQAQWFVDGEAAFEAIATSIEGAKSEIFITGWWLCPELYLRRPFHSNPSSRLDALLEEKAKQGVQIFILLYKEVSIALKINSSYSKRLLSNIHENVRVMRYPDRFPTGIYLWSHHEKLVIVDYQICFMGGLDLCFGRYDTVEHKVGDCPPHIWPGKDYYNPRESEPNSWEDAMQDELDREKYPRMPWHDVHCALWGPPCRDIARHFVQRWNHAKRNKAPNEQTIPLLMPQHHMVLPHYLGRSSEIDIEKKNKEENQNGICRENSFSSLSPTTTTTNSFSSPSPVQNIPLLLPQEDGLDAPIENQKLSAVNLNHNLFDQPADDLDPDTQMKGFTDDLHSKDLKSEANLNNMTHSGSTTSDESSESSEGGDHSVAADDYGQIGPRTACHCQNQFFISGLSGDEIIQNRVLETLYRRIVLAYKEQKCFRVIVVIPLLPGFQGGVDDGGAATVRAIMHWQYRTISWEKHSILHKLKVKLGPKTHDYISFYGLRTYGRLFEGGPVATSQVYVHSKVMIIDDRISLIGSSNINDRSLLGSRDSEIGVVLEDKEFLESSMNGQPWKAGKFAYSLRCSLWSEHLGLQAGEINQISDPVSDTTYKNLWLETAKENSIIYEDVFSCIPNDSIHSRAALRQCKAQWKDKHGHTTIDLGIAPEKLLESGKDGEAKETDPMERLKHVRGHLVSFPLEFMQQEDLRPVFNESEFYTSPQVFH